MIRVQLVLNLALAEARQVLNLLETFPAGTVELQSAQPSQSPQNPSEPKLGSQPNQSASPSPSPSASEQSAKSEPKLTATSMRKLLIDACKVDADSANAIIKEYGAEKLSQVKPEDLPAIKTKLEALISTPI